MPTPLASAPRRLSAPLGQLRRMRRVLADGAVTTLHVAAYPLREVAVRLQILARPRPLADWCAHCGVSDALVGGFFTMPEGIPLGEVRHGGIPRFSIPFHAPWHRVRSCVRIEQGWPSIARRDELPPAPSGDLLQVGPLLVRDGVNVVRLEDDPEGFSAGADQFRSDITAGRHPRAALGLAPGRMLAVVCDGRANADAGLTLAELAETLVELGARTAINLDGGGSASLVTAGELRNQPRDDFEVALPDGRPLATALVFAPRSAAA